MKITKPYYIIFLLFITFFVLFSQLFMVKREGLESKKSSAIEDKSLETADTPQKSNQ
jgi:hypothetical protein